MIKSQNCTKLPQSVPSIGVVCSGMDIHKIELTDTNKITTHVVCEEEIGNLTTRRIGGSTTLLFPGWITPGPAVHTLEFDTLLVLLASWIGDFVCCKGVVCPNA